MPKTKLEIIQANKIKKLDKELKEAELARKRLAADYANLERRFDADKEILKKRAGHHLLEKLFPIFDNFYRASSHAPAINLNDLAKLTDEELEKVFNYFEGLKLIEKQMEATLAEAGLTRIPTKGAQFDHNLHEAISYESNSEIPADHIIDEIEAGWQIDSHVVKPAKVRVSRG
ncbi:MAG TPA: nucleotide exchange factor GrpE [Candidatus Saccharimonadales bacterium]|nr:nucleotide exchange factor GrpE [Candidatus Saccharimonadales bacterium]